MAQRLQLIAWPPVSWLDRPRPCFLLGGAPGQQQPWTAHETTARVWRGPSGQDHRVLCHFLANGLTPSACEQRRLRSHVCHCCMVGPYFQQPAPHVRSRRDKCVGCALDRELILHLRYATILLFTSACDSCTASLTIWTSRAPNKMSTSISPPVCASSSMRIDYSLRSSTLSCADSSLLSHLFDDQ